MLTDADLAYMRQTHGESRPTEATLATRRETDDDMGGEATDFRPGTAVSVSVDSRDTRGPAVLQERYPGALVAIRIDLVDVRPGDRITVDPEEVYEVVSEGTPDEWATAQTVWAVRTQFAQEPA